MKDKTIESIEYYMKWGARLIMMVLLFYVILSCFFMKNVEIKTKYTVGELVLVGNHACQVKAITIKDGKPVYALALKGTHYVLPDVEESEVKSLLYGNVEGK